MSDLHDLAKLNYVIENYDNIREGKRSAQYKNADGSYSKTVELQKKIDDKFYYVVEAVPDAKLKTLHVVSAYINKNDTFLEVAVSKDPSRYVQDELQSNVSSNNIISKDAENTTENRKYSFSGVNAQTANQSQLQIAMQMEENEATSEEIRKETGWHRGYDNKWRFEIDDSGSYLLEDPILQSHFDEDGSYHTGKLEDILKHEELYKAYPELKNLDIVIQQTETGVMGAAFSLNDPSKMVYRSTE